ncbi:hypothetical protein JYP51_09605 [Ponticoccus gilvus]|nr:hypothetical protein [Enemella evansiae]
MEQQQFMQLVEERRAELGLSMAALSQQAFGNGKLTAVQDLKRGASPSLDRISKLCKALGLEFYIGPPREDSSPSKQVSQEEFATVALFDAHLSAGDGHSNHNDLILGFLAFRRDWLRRLGVSPSDAVLARAKGDSMQPTIWDKDLVLIDTTRKEVPIRSSATGRRRSPVYALLEDGAARLKRIERPSEEQVMLISDNPDFPPELCHPKDVSIIGKVLWWGHTSQD